MAESSHRCPPIGKQPTKRDWNQKPHTSDMVKSRPVTSLGWTRPSSRGAAPASTCLLCCRRRYGYAPAKFMLMDLTRRYSQKWCATPCVWCVCVYLVVATMVLMPVPQINIQSNVQQVPKLPGLRLLCWIFPSRQPGVACGLIVLIIHAPRSCRCTAPRSHVFVA